MLFLCDRRPLDDHMGLFVTREPINIAAVDWWGVLSTYKLAPAAAIGVQGSTQVGLVIIERW